MIKLRNVTKTYRSGDYTVRALDEISVQFRDNEFVAIVGESGSGKSTLLNVIGGLLTYDSGEMLIQGTSTRDFKAHDWDAYRNHSIGFIFQNYQLITHLSVLANVEMGMTLAGVPTSERREKAKKALERVGLIDHINKRPNQLSGGQMQRVAIARALVNDPDIILADEPTGALDQETSREIMDLLKEISEEKLIIMVTHSMELAESYADRRIIFSDGHIIDDSNPTETERNDQGLHLNATGMSMWTALKLSFQNIMTKKGRTFLTAFASSIGIIGVALVLSLSNGMQKQIDNFERESMSSYPIAIENETISFEAMMQQGMEINNDSSDAVAEGTLEAHTFQENLDSIAVQNDITPDYIAYLEKMPNDLLQGLRYTYGASLNLLTEKGDEVTKVDPVGGQMDAFPSLPNERSLTYLQDQYELIAGEWPQSGTDMILATNDRQKIDSRVLEALGITIEEGEALDLKTLVGKTYQLVPQDVYYKNSEDFYLPPTSTEELTTIYNNEANKEVKISGIVRLKEAGSGLTMMGGMFYSGELMEQFIEDAMASEIVQAQRDSDINVVTQQPFAAEREPSISQGMQGAPTTASQLTKNDWLSYLGGSDSPNKIEIYPGSFDDKDDVIVYLDAWNDQVDEEEQIVYSDQAALITDLSSGIMGTVTYVLVAFAGISLVVSMVMIGIIIYISVLERTQEIGILRALGAREKDITRVFNAETLIIGLASGLIGLATTYSALPLINQVIERLTDLPNVAQLNPVHAGALLLISIVLTFIGGVIPAKMAAKKDPVEALSGD